MVQTLPLEIFDAVTDASDPVSAVGFDVTKPVAAKAGVGDDARENALGQHFFESSQQQPGVVGLL